MGMGQGTTKRRVDHLDILQGLAKGLGSSAMPALQIDFPWCSGSQEQLLFTDTALVPRKEITRSCPVYTQPLSGATGGPDLIVGEVLCICIRLQGCLLVWLPWAISGASFSSHQGCVSPPHLPPSSLGLFGWLISLDPADTGVFSLNQSGSRKAQLSSQRHCSPQLWVRTQAF